MPFIGNQPTQGRFIELDSLTASATDDYTLQLNGANFAPESVNNLLVSINGVIQGSSTMSLNGAVLTVGATLSSSDTIDFVRVFGNVGTVSTPTDGSVTANKIGTGAVTTDKLADNSVTSAKITGVSFGKVLQVQNFQTGNVATGTTRLPLDDSIPQNSEGTEFMTLAITPTSATSKLRIEVLLICCYSADAVITSMLFQDNTANALACNYNWSGGSGTRNISMYLSHFMTAGTTSATTFKIRAGGDNAGTLTFNGRTGARQYGGTLASSITITEIGA